MIRSLTERLGTYPELLAKLQVLWLSRHVRWSKLERLAGDGVRKRVLVLNIISIVLGRKQVRHRAALGGDSLGADLGRLTFGDAVEDVGELVIGVLADLLGDVRVFVVKGSGGAEGLDEVEVVRGAGCDYVAAGSGK